MWPTVSEVQPDWSLPPGAGGRPDSHCAPVRREGDYRAPVGCTMDWDEYLDAVSRRGTYAACRPVVTVEVEVLRCPRG